MAGRRALLDDPQFVAEFRRDWYHGRRGRNLAHFKARMGLPDILVVRELDRMVFDGAPVPDWEGETLQQVYDRLVHFQSGNSDSARSDAERESFATFPGVILDDAEFMLHLMRTYDKGFRFWVDVANENKEGVLPLLLDPNTMPGFNDSGAHITNMAFFDGNLSSLKLAQQDSLLTVSAMVKRLTRDPAAFFGLDVGSLEIGAQADIVLIDPEALSQWDDNESREFTYRELFEHKQLLSRSDGVVSQVLIRGEPVWREGAFTEALGTRQLGRALRAA